MIQFYRGLKAKYLYPSDSKFADALYFATDTGELLVNGVNYGSDTEKLKDVVFNNNILTFTKSDNSTIEIDLTDKLLSTEDRSALDLLKQALENNSFNANYVTELDHNIATVMAIGGIPAGTTVGTYADLPLSRVIDDLLFPTVLPTVTNPSASLKAKSGVALTREVGSNSPIASDFTTTWNPGLIKINATILNTRAGEKTSEVLYKNAESNVVTSTAEKVTLGTTSYYYKVYYAEGPLPKDSKGNLATSYTALPAGSVVSTAVVVYGVYPFYATTTDNNIASHTVTKIPLTNATSFSVKMAGEKDGEGGTILHQVLKIPYTVTKIEALNTLSNQYEVVNLENWVKTTESIDVNGANVDYNVYTRNESKSGETTFRITYSK